MALLPFMPQAAYGQMGTTSAPLTAPVQDVTEPFVWGAGGRRMTPEQMEAERAIAQSLMQSNYSPVGSVWEGLGRVADNVTGALQARKLDKTDQANTARSDAVLQALMGGNGGDVAAQAMTDPYLSPQVQGLAKMMWDRANPKPQAPNDFERALEASGVMRGTPQWQEAMAAKVKNTLDPFTSIVAGGNTIMGRQSLVEQSLGGGQAPGGMPRVTDQASYDAIPAGAQFMTPEGDIRVKGGQSGSPSTGGF